MKGYVTNIERETLKNRNYEKVLFTGKHHQLIVMSLKPGEDIGEEAPCPAFPFPVAQRDSVSKGTLCADGGRPELVVGQPAVGVLKRVLVAC